MKNYINNQHSYYTLDYYLKEKYQSKVFKVALNGNFTCPNRDGTKAYGGCIFCSDSGSGDFSGNKEDSLITQFNEVKDIISKKWPNSKYIAYFQANSNTYAPLDKLKSLYEEALSLRKDIVGLDIATRPDCISDECLEYLAYLNSIVFSGNKVCTAASGTTQTLVDSACNGISLTATVGSENATTTSMASITGHTLAKNTAELITVVIDYATGSAWADGNFTVTFPNNVLTYGSAD